VDIIVAVSAQHEGLATARSHQPDPTWFLTWPRLSQISDLADVVDLDVLV